MKEPGQLALFRFPQTDLTVGKLRPALLLAKVPAHNDWLVCMVSSQIKHAVSGLDEVLMIADADFARSGLRVSSVIRVTRLAVVSESVFIGSVGQISRDRLDGLKQRLATWIQST